jgi:hypothetical protein
LENRSILTAFLAVWALYLGAVYWYAARNSLAKTIVTLSHAAPSVVAVLMAYVFLIMRGATVRQFVSNSQRGVDLWSLWVVLWPQLLLLTFGAAVCQAMWLIAACFRKSARIWIPVALSGVLMSGFAFATVISNFPDA